MEATALILIEPIEDAPVTVRRVETLAGDGAFDVEVCTPAAAPRRLQVLCAEGRSPVGALVGPHTPCPLALARRLRGISPLLPIVFLADPKRAAGLRRQMSAADLSEAHWEIADVRGDDLRRTLRERGLATVQQGRTRSVLGQIPREHSPKPLPNRFDHHPLVLSDRYLASILEQTEDAMLSIDPQGCLLTWNRAAERLFLTPELEALGRNADTLAGGDWASELPAGRRGPPAGGGGDGLCGLSAQAV